MIGASTDPRDVNEGFKQEQGFHFPLLSDEGGAATQALGILNESGRAKRTTYLIDSRGKVAKIFENVQIDGHAAAVLAAAQLMQGK